MRHAKQLIYGIFYVALWAGLIGGVYALQRPEPSCFDGRQNQNETGVDCGGVCAKVCIPVTIAPLQAGSAQMIILGQAASGAEPEAGVAPALRVSLVAEVQNSNPGFGASNFEYTFTIHGSDGGVIASFPGRSFVYPGEIKYLTLLNVPLPVGAVPASARIATQNTQWSPADRFPRPELRIQTVSTEVSNDNLVSRGILVNQDRVNFQTVHLTALFYDAAGRVAGVSGTERNNVSAGESREFTLFHPLIQGAVPERTRVFATAFNPR